MTGRVYKGDEPLARANRGMRAAETAKRQKTRRGEGSRGMLKVVGNRCPAKKKDGTQCRQPAGYGTNHLGTGCCRYHGGSMPNHVKAAAKEEMRILLGKPIDTNPYEAIMTCIRIRSGEVAWLSEKMAELDEKEWTESSLVGKQLHIWAKERQAAMSDLVRYSQIAISLNISERAIRLAEGYADTIAALLRGVLADLEPFLSPEGRQRAPQIIRRQLLLMEGVRVPIDGEVVESTAVVEA